MKVPHHKFQKENTIEWSCNNGKVLVKTIHQEDMRCDEIGLPVQNLQTILLVQHNMSTLFHLY